MAHSKIITIMLLLILPAGVFSQTNDSIRKKITGTWTLVRHTLSEKGKEVNKLTSATKSTYEFKDNGDFVSTLFSTYEGKSETVVTVGKWKISANGKSILLFNAKFLPPHDKDGIESDHPLEIKKLTLTELIVPEYLFDEGTAGTSFYRKTK